MTDVVHVHLPDLPWSALIDDASSRLLPNLVSMIEDGSSGVLPPVGPHPSIEGMLMTGRPPSLHGLFSYESVRIDGLGTDRANRKDLRCATIWERLDASGMASASLNFPATRFSRSHHGLVVGDVFFMVCSPDADAWPILPGAIAMAGGDPRTFHEWRLHPEALSERQIDVFFEAPSRADATARRIVARLLSENASVHCLATHLLETGAAGRALFVRYDALSAWNLQRMRLEGAAAERRAAWEFARMLDAFVGRLMALVTGEETLFVVTGGVEEWPFCIARGPDVPVDRLWPDGFDLASVPGLVAKRLGIESFPTRGRDDEPAPVCHHLAPTDDGWSSAEGIEIDWSAPPAVDAHGIAGPGRSRTLHMQACRHDGLMACAEYLRLNGAVEAAREHYRRILEEAPAHVLATAGLCRCELSDGDLEAARACLDALRTGEGERVASIRDLEIEMLVREGRIDDALEAYLPTVAGRTPTVGSARLAAMLAQACRARGDDRLATNLDRLALEGLWRGGVDLDFGDAPTSRGPGSGRPGSGAP